MRPLPKLCLYLLQVRTYNCICRIVPHIGLFVVVDGTHARQLAVDLALKRVFRRRIVLPPHSSSHVPVVPVIVRLIVAVSLIVVATVAATVHGVLAIAVLLARLLLTTGSPDRDGRAKNNPTNAAEHFRNPKTVHELLSRWASRLRLANKADD